MELSKRSSDEQKEIEMMDSKDLETIESVGSKPSDHQSDGENAEMQFDKQIYDKQQVILKLKSDCEEMKSAGKSDEIIAILEKIIEVSKEINELIDLQNKKIKKSKK